MEDKWEWTLEIPACKRCLGLLGSRLVVWVDGMAGVDVKCMHGLLLPFLEFHYQYIPVPICSFYFNVNDCRLLENASPSDFTLNSFWPSSVHQHVLPALRNINSASLLSPRFSFDSCSVGYKPHLRLLHVRET